METDMSKEEKAERFLQLFLESSVEAAYEEYRKTETYESLSTLESQLFERLKKSASGSVRNVLLVYSDTMAEIMTDEQKFFYKKGFNECLTLMKMWL